MKDYNCELIGRIVSVEENPDGVEFYINAKRSADKEDLVPVIISNEVLGETELNVDQTVKVLGVIKTIRSKETYKSRLRVSATSIEIVSEDTKNKNMVFGRFDVKATKSIRVTRTGYKVKDVILRKEYKSEIGPSEFRAIFWNEDAEQYDNISEGTELYIVGRLQSREYLKRTSTGNNRVRTYEVSIGKVEDDTDKYAEEV